GAEGTAPFPLLAVASWNKEISQPMLRLYNANTGEWLRQFQGHTRPIRALAAAADGRLLASVAEDQTVCIWSLVDLHKIVGKHGELQGVYVEQQDKALVVTQVLTKNPVHPRPARGDQESRRAREKLQKGDRIVSLQVLQKGMNPRPV